MQRIDWMARAVESEVAYSVARGGVATDHGDFMYVHNPHVPWVGDYTRAIGVKVSDSESFANVVKRVEELNRERQLPRPDCYDTYPSSDGDAWISSFDSSEYRPMPRVFFRLDVANTGLPPGFTWRPVEEDEFLAWRHNQMQAQDWFDAAEWELGLPLERQFLQVYKPYWLFENGQLVAWVHCANLGSHFRLFDVEVDTPLLGRGYGRILLQAVSAEASAQGVPHILIRCVERLRGFYETCGFEECGKGTVIRLREDA